MMLCTPADMKNCTKMNSYKEEYKVKYVHICPKAEEKPNMKNSLDLVSKYLLHIL